MKKLFIDARAIGYTGIGRYIYDLIAYWDSLNIEGYALLYYKTNLQLKNIKTIKTKVKIYNPLEHILIPSIVKRLNSEFIYYSPHYIYPLIDLKRVIPVIEIQDIIHLRYNNFKSKIAFFLMWNSLRKAKKIITHAEYTKRKIIETFPCEKEKIRVIPLGLSPLFKKTHKVDFEILKKKYQIPDNFWLTSGGFFEHKNIKFSKKLLNMWNERETEKFHLVVIGNKRLKKVKKMNNIIFLPYLSEEEIKTLYSHAKIFIFPSKEEGFGLPVLESLYVNCPVVISNIPVFEELYPKLPKIDIMNLEKSYKIVKKVLRNKEISLSYRNAILKKYDFNKTAEMLSEEIFNL